jgi:hypothetical protein
MLRSEAFVLREAESAVALVLVYRGGFTNRHAVPPWSIEEFLTAKE